MSFVLLSVSPPVRAKCADQSVGSIIRPVPRAVGPPDHGQCGHSGGGPWVGRLVGFGHSDGGLTSGSSVHIPIRSAAIILWYRRASGGFARASGLGGRRKHPEPGGPSTVGDSTRLDHFPDRND